MATIRCHPDTPLSRLLAVGEFNRPVFVHVPGDQTSRGLDWKIEFDLSLEPGVITNEWGSANYAVALPAEDVDPQTGIPHYLAPPVHQWDDPPEDPWLQVPARDVPQNRYTVPVTPSEYPVLNYDHIRRGPTLAELRRMTERQIRELPTEDFHGPQGRTNDPVNQPPQQAFGSAGGGDAAGGDGLVPGDEDDVRSDLQRLIDVMGRRYPSLFPPRRPEVGRSLEERQGHRPVRYANPPGEILGDSTQRTTARTGQGDVVLDEIATRDPTE